MDIGAIAKKCVDDIFDQAEADGRVMHRDAMQKRIVDVLTREMKPSGPYAYGGLCIEAPVDISATDILARWRGLDDMTWNGA